MLGQGAKPRKRLRRVSRLRNGYDRRCLAPEGTIPLFSFRPIPEVDHQKVARKRIALPRYRGLKVQFFFAQPVAEPARTPTPPTAYALPLNGTTF